MNKPLQEVKSLDDNIRTASIVLECISALCDGQYRKIQGYLLDQDQSFKVQKNIFVNFSYV